MRKVLYLKRLDDGATKVSVYSGEVGQGTLKEYGVRSPRLVKRIRKYAQNVGKGGPYRDEPESEAYEIME